MSAGWTPIADEAERAARVLHPDRHGMPRPAARRVMGVANQKGGVGKTTVTATLGATFASHRGDRVVAVDANPDRGTLSQKIPLETTATVRHLLRDADRVRRYSDVRAYTSQGVSRLEVLASEQDPAVSEAFSEDDYRRAVDLLEHFYNLVLTDCGTGLMHSAMYGVLRLIRSKSSRVRSTWASLAMAIRCSTARRAERGPRPGSLARSWIRRSISGPAMVRDIGL